MAEEKRWKVLFNRKGLVASDQSVFTLAEEFYYGYVDRQEPRNTNGGSLLAVGGFEGTQHKTPCFAVALLILYES
jgi:hypothetical protein